MNKYQQKRWLFLTVYIKCLDSLMATKIESLEQGLKNWA